MEDAAPVKSYIERIASLDRVLETGRPFSAYARSRPGVSGVRPLIFVDPGYQAIHENARYPLPNSRAPTELTPASEHRLIPPLPTMLNARRLPAES